MSGFPAIPEKVWTANDALTMRPPGPGKIVHHALIGDEQDFCAINAQGARQRAGAKVR